MKIMERVELYKNLFKDSVALAPVGKAKKGWVEKDSFEKLETLRVLNTELSELYQVSLPVITVWVRDDCYITSTGEIYLCDPGLENFLHQYRHHLQNVERKYERRGLTCEGLGKEFWSIPYKDCLHRMRGEDDARAWSKFLIEAAEG
ncbi:MAG: hypothetical protein LIO94_02325 [Clostridiales bacterium]|nr:hypothetical protein [Clostridiales bacterium]